MKTKKWKKPVVRSIEEQDLLQRVKSKAHTDHTDEFHQDIPGGS